MTATRPEPIQPPIGTHVCLFHLDELLMPLGPLRAKVVKHFRRAVQVEFRVQGKSHPFKVSALAFAADVVEADALEVARDANIRCAIVIPGTEPKTPAVIENQGRLFS